MITAGLNVPADSQPLPRGAITGVSARRRQCPNGNRGLPCAARRASSASSVSVLLAMKRPVCIVVDCRGFELARKKKRQGRPPAALRCLIRPDYFLFTDFFSSAPGLNFATLRAAILIVAPVCGLRPFRAFLCDTEKVPNPINATRSPLRSAEVMLSTAVSMAVVACALLISHAPAILSTRSALFMRFSSQVSFHAQPSSSSPDRREIPAMAESGNLTARILLRLQRKSTVKIRAGSLFCTPRTRIGAIRAAFQSAGLAFPPPSTGHILGSQVVHRETSFPACAKPVPGAKSKEENSFEHDGFEGGQFEDERFDDGRFEEGR